MVAAYLVGSRGTLKHALALGGIVTFTHTGIVLAVGLITLAASRYLVPTDLFPILEIASGVLIIIMGLSLLRQRWRGWRSVRQKRERERVSGEFGLSTSPPSGKQRIAIGEAVPVQVFDAALPVDDRAGMVHWRSLIVLGVSGGLVPCPDAIAILLVAVAINRIALGLSLIVTFSLGLAMILIAIGVAIVQSKHLFARFDRVERHAPAISVVSAVIVLGLGLGLTWQAANGSGFLAQSVVAETPISTPIAPLTAAINKPRPSITLQNAQIIYQVSDDQGLAQLYAVPAAGGEPVPLSEAPYGIWDYTIAPDKQTLVYVQIREDRGSDLWLLAGNGRHESLLECPAVACTKAIFNSDGSRILYSRLEFGSENLFGTTTLWQLDVTTGETEPIFQDSNLPGYSPGWSDDGQWLSYIVPGTPATIHIYNLMDGRHHELSLMSGMGGVWQPAGESLVYAEIDTAALKAGSPAATRLQHFDAAMGEITDLSQSTQVNDRGAVWSPDGAKIAFLRQEMTNDLLERGNQIWLMDEDGRNAQPLTAIPNTLHRKTGLVVRRPFPLIPTSRPRFPPGSTDHPVA